MVVDEDDRRSEMANHLGKDVTRMHDACGERALRKCFLSMRLSHSRSLRAVRFGMVSPSGPGDRRRVHHDVAQAGAGGEKK